ncbi:5-formyltetrahydrofolate cyclo-ligase [Alkalihalophilus sp. As8PL]|uniref:5-formyltetrahydrofolate cyclo-ligase n=1 Tax=Alkalihalophilus sp. As8PL TaxID=3237103 RepID=A0AB39BU29_9BACI
MNDKEECRKMFKQSLKNLSDLAVKQQSNELTNQLVMQPYWIEATVIGLTISKEKEVDTTTLIQHAWADGKQVVVPKVKKGTREMSFYQIYSFDDLEDIFFGLKEPIQDRCKKIEKNVIDLVIVPGLGFDLQGFRMGYGGGFYDTYLEGFNGVTCALAFDCQVIRSIPIEDHDQQIDHLIVPHGVIR